MVIRVLLIVFFFVAYVTTEPVAAAGQCTKGSEFEPALCPLKLGRVSKISILKNAAKSPVEQDNAVVCDNFLLSQARLRQYWSQAKIIREDDLHHTLDWSPCYASGEILFSDGSSAEWTVNQFRSGSLLMRNGKKIPLYCPTCKFSPFQW
ncbi:hypothetical protein AAKU64_000184 [Undibacterium sp. GrIS 1.8]